MKGLIGMADNQLIGKWYVSSTDEDTENAEEKAIQFYKDGSCLVPVKFFGSDSETFPMYYFFQAFENMTVKFDSGEPGLHMFRYSIEGDRLAFTTMDGKSEFVFEKEAKKPLFSFKSAVEKVKPEKQEEKEEVEAEPTENEWKCPVCGTINQNYVGTCGCGETRPADILPFVQFELPPDVKKIVKEEVPEEPKFTVDEPEEKKETKKEEEIPEVEPTENEWKCPVCGTINQNYVGTCGCGEARPADVLPFVQFELPPDVQKIVDDNAPPVVEEKFKAVEDKKEKKEEEVPEVEPTENEWKCPVCGTINQNYVGTCGCGEARPADVLPFVQFELPPDVKKIVGDNAAPAEEPKFASSEPEKDDTTPESDEPQPTENEWKCPTCGKINQNYVGTCGCGQSKPE